MKRNAAEPLERLALHSPPVAPEATHQDSNHCSSLDEAMETAVRQVVRVTLVRTRRPRGERRSDLGTGRLLDELALGRRVRIEVEPDCALVTTPVREVKRLSRNVVKVVTANSVYRLEIAPSNHPRVSARERFRPHIPDPWERLANLHRLAKSWVEAVSGRSCPPIPGSPSEPSLPDDSTGFVALSDLSKPGSGPFGPGTRVQVWRKERRARSGDRSEEVGVACVLDRLDVGEPARVAVEGGPTLATSPVQEIRLLDPNCIELETANTIYRLERIPPSGEDRG